ncbi:MAG: hypothetical protein HY343_11640 [Lentisphaerae bacterium]|nr:hypothetical protein [Lentisphaerota bacterium]
MNRIRRYFIISVSVMLVALTGSCVRSLFSFYTDDAKIKMPALNGAWRMLDEHGTPKMQKPWVFKDNEILTYSEKGGSGVLEVVYFKINDTIFMDTSPQESDSTIVSEWWSLHTFPCHYVSKIETNGNRLTVIPLDFKWLAQALQDGRVDLPAQKDPKNGKDGPLLYTASPEQWMAFLKTHGANAEAFPPKGAYVFVTAGDDVLTQISTNFHKADLAPDREAELKKVEK